MFFFLRKDNCIIK